MTASRSSGEQLNDLPADPPSFQLDERRRLRLWEEADAEELYAIVDQNREYLARWLPWPPLQTLEGTLEFIRMSHRQFLANQGFQAAVVADERIVGGIGFHRIDWENRSTTIGYWLAESAQGQGTMTQAVQALVEHAFRTWRLNRVEIRAGVGNERSRAIPGRLGFSQEGVLRHAERIGDRYVDLVVYSMLAGDWKG